MIATFEVRTVMRKAILIPVLALTALSVTACGKKAANEALEANETMPGDSNTMGEAVADQNAAEAAAFNDTEASYSTNSTTPPPAAAGNGEDIED
jgi:predicted small lipoprotein YifL